MKPIRGRGRRTQAPKLSQGSLECNPRNTNATPQAARPVAMRPGNGAGPKCWPGMEGKLCTCHSTARPNSSSAAPVRASWIFRRSLLLGDADCLHHRAEIGVRLGHELHRVLRAGPDHAEAALCHEIA